MQRNAVSSICRQHGGLNRRIWRSSNRLLAEPIALRSVHTRSSPRLIASSPAADLGCRSFSQLTRWNSRSIDDTVFALSTAPGRAAIAIVRISGPACTQIYQKLCPQTRLPRPRLASVRTLYDPSLPPSRESVLDSNALVLYFESPNTSTGEDVLEFHIHGGTAIVSAVLKAIASCSPANLGTVKSIRYAEPGEFTQRAYYNNRLDLTQVEALGDMLSATTEQQRRVSLRGSSSQLGKRYADWRAQLLAARGELEALIDFSEDQHLDDESGGASLTASVVAQVHALSAGLEKHIANAMRGELLRNGISVALLGAPNAGKSSLLNCIVGRKAAIVSASPGTTRDVIDIGIDLGGYLCRIADTAGLRSQLQEAQIQLPDDIWAIEQDGIERAKQRAEEAHVVVLVVEVARSNNGAMNLHIDPEVASIATQRAEKGSPVLVVVNKIDLLEGSIDKLVIAAEIRTHLPTISPSNIYPLSCLSSSTTKEVGIQPFLTGLISTFDALTAQGDTATLESLGATERHRMLLEECLGFLRTFISRVSGETADGNEGDIVIAAEALRQAAECLARITGHADTSDVEEVLGVVFEKFCVGK